MIYEIKCKLCGKKTGEVNMPGVVSPTDLKNSDFGIQQSICSDCELKTKGIGSEN